MGRETNRKMGRSGGKRMGMNRIERKYRFFSSRGRGEDKMMHVNNCVYININCNKSLKKNQKQMKKCKTSNIRRRRRRTSRVTSN